MDPDDPPTHEEIVDALTDVLTATAARAREEALEEARFLPEPPAVPEGVLVVEASSAVAAVRRSTRRTDRGDSRGRGGRGLSSC